MREKTAFGAGMITAPVASLPLYLLRLALGIGGVAGSFALVPAFGREIPVEAPAAFAAACAEARPGDTLMLKAGEWRDAALVFKAEGTAEAPITLTAATPGGVRLTGRSTLAFAGRHLIVRGLVFTEGYVAKGAVVSFGGAAGAADDCRLTECAIIRYNPPNPRDRSIRYQWVQLHGNRHRVDHCRFEGGNHFGVTLQVVVGPGDNRHRIDHNYFLDRAPGGGNGFESLQLGQAADSHRDSNSIVEYNLFESCDGEQEIVSNKSGANVYRKNTFKRSAGALTLRHGDGCTVEANVFLGDLKPQTGGVRVIGRRHVVRGNYFHGLTGLPTAGAVIALYAGIPNSVPTGYVESEAARVAENVLIDNAANGINLSGGIGSRGRTILPRGVAVTNNWIDQHPSFGATVLTGTPAEGLVCAGNFYSPHSELGYAPSSGFTHRWFEGDPDADFPQYPPLAPPATKDHAGWRATMAALETLTPKDVGPAWWGK